jgi:hypothetical protein
MHVLKLLAIAAVGMRNKPVRQKIARPFFKQGARRKAPG